MSAALLSNQALDSSSISDISESNAIVHNTPIGENSISVETMGQSRSIQISPSQIGINQGHVIKNRITQNSPTQVGSFQIGSSQTGISQIDTLKVRPSQPSIDQLSMFQIGTAQIGIDQQGLIQGSSDQNRLPQISSTQVNLQKVSPGQISSSEDTVFEMTFSKVAPPQSEATQVSVFQFALGEIPLPSSITLQQFLSSHDYNSQNTTVPPDSTSYRTPLHLTSTLKSPISSLANSPLLAGFSLRYPHQIYQRPPLTTNDDANSPGCFIDPILSENSESLLWRSCANGTQTSEFSTIKAFQLFQLMANKSGH